MKLPKLSDLIGEQMDVYDADPQSNLFVAGPPGSGKTTLAISRAQNLVVLGKSFVIITKNRMLAALASQLGGVGVSTSTMHKFVATDYGQRFGELVPKLGQYDYDWQKVLAKYTITAAVPKFDHLIIDEAQNLPREFFPWAVQFGATNISVFADEDQTTNSERATLKNIFDAGLPMPIKLVANHRNTEEIALVAEHFHTSALLPPGVVQRGRSGEIPTLVQVASVNEMLNFVTTRYKNRGSSIGLIIRKKIDAPDLLAQLRVKLPSPVRLDYYTSDTIAGSEHKIKTFDPGITILTSESVIGLEFDEVFIQDLARSLPCTNHLSSRRMYMLCARARDSLFLINGPTPLTTIQVAALPDNTILLR